MSGGTPHMGEIQCNTAGRVSSFLRCICCIFCYLLERQRDRTDQQNELPKCLQWPGQATFPVWMAGTCVLSILHMVCVRGGWNKDPEPGLEPRYCRVGCRHLKPHLDPQATQPSLATSDLKIHNFNSSTPIMPSSPVLQKPLHFDFPI